MIRQAFMNNERLCDHTLFMCSILVLLCSLSLRHLRMHNVTRVGGTACQRDKMQGVSPLKQEWYVHPALLPSLIISLQALGDQLNFTRTARTAVLNRHRNASSHLGTDKCSCSHCVDFALVRLVTSISNRL